MWTLVYTSIILLLVAPTISSELESTSIQNKYEDNPFHIDKEEKVLIPNIQNIVENFSMEAIFSEETLLSPTSAPTSEVSLPLPSAAPSLSWNQPGFWFYCIATMGNLTLAEVSNSTIQNILLHSLASSLNLPSNHLIIDVSKSVNSTLSDPIISSYLRKVFDYNIIPSIHAESTRKAMQQDSALQMTFGGWLSVAEFAIYNFQPSIALSSLQSALDSSEELTALVNEINTNLRESNIIVQSSPIYVEQVQFVLNKGTLSSPSSSPTIQPSIYSSPNNKKVKSAIFFTVGHIRIDAIEELLIALAVLSACILILSMGCFCFFYPKGLQKLFLKTESTSYDQDSFPRSNNYQGTRVNHDETSSCLCCISYGNIYSHKISEPFEMYNPECESNRFSGSTNNSTNTTESMNSPLRISNSRSYYSYYKSNWSKKKVHIDPSAHNSEPESSKEDELYSHYCIRSPNSQYAIELNAIQ